MEIAPNIEAIDLSLFGCLPDANLTQVRLKREVFFAIGCALSRHVVLTGKELRNEDAFTKKGFEHHGHRYCWSSVNKHS